MPIIDVSLGFSRFRFPALYERIVAVEAMDTRLIAPDVSRILLRQRLLVHSPRIVPCL